MSRKWSGERARCQICLNWRLVAANGLMPRHVLSGNYCSGSNALPFEKDTGVAKFELQRLEGLIEVLRGIEKSSAIRRIKNLKKVINSYANAPKQIGTWQILTSYPLEDAYQVEAIAHQMLSTYLDRDAPIGEVFACRPEVAIAAVETAITAFQKMTSDKL